MNKILVSTAAIAVVAVIMVIPGNVLTPTLGKQAHAVPVQRGSDNK